MDDLEKGYTKKKNRRYIPKVGRSYKRHMEETKTFDKSLTNEELIEAILEDLNKGGPGSGKKGHKTSIQDFNLELRVKKELESGRLDKLRGLNRILNSKKKKAIQQNDKDAAKYYRDLESKVAYKMIERMSKSEQENTMSIEKEMDEMAEKMEKAFGDHKAALKETIKELGLEGLKKSMTNISEEQKELLKSVLEEMKEEALEKAVEMDANYAAKRRRENIKDTNYDTEFADDDADEKLVKPEAAQHNHQGDITPEGREGQIIKSELASLKEEIIKSYVDAGLDYTEDMVKGMMKKKYMAKMCKGDEDKEEDKKIADKEAKEEVKIHENKMHKKEMKKADTMEKTRTTQETELGDGMSAAKLSEEDQTGNTNKATEGTSRAKKEKAENLEIKAETIADEVKVEGMKKSINWASDNDRLKANTGGRNHHFSVNDYYDAALAKSKEEVEEETLEKSEKIQDLNDLIEKSMDQSWDQVNTKRQLDQQSIRGNQKSFDDADMAAMFNFTDEEIKTILGE